MLRRLSALVIVVAFAAFCSRGAFEAHADDQDAVSVIDGLQQFATAADSLAGFEELGESIPLTDTTPSEALGLDNLFSELLGTFAPADDDSLAALQSALEGLDGADSDSVDIVVGCADEPCDGGGEDGVTVTKTGDVVSVHLPVSASKALTLDLGFESDVIDFNGGDLSITFSISTVLDFELDTIALADPGQGLAQAFAIAGEPVIEARVSANGSLTSFSAVLGFVDVSVGGNIVLDFGFDATLNDPENALVDPMITLDELSSTALADLVTIAPGGTNSLTGTVNFDASLIGGVGTDGTLTFTDTTLPLGNDFTFALGALEQVRHITAMDAFRALQRLNSWLDGLQAGGVLDLEIPLLDGTYSDVLAIGKKLAEAVEGAPETACGGNADDDGDGRRNDGCEKQGATSEQGAQCANDANDDPGDDAFVNDGCPAAGGLLKLDDPNTPLDEEGDPAFDDAQELADLLESKLGISSITPVFAGNALSYQLDLGDSASKVIDLDFGGSLDVLSGINISTGGTVNLTAGYTAGLAFGVDLTPQPTEDGAGIGSCEDGLDNSAEPGNALPDDGETDAADTDCATLKTIDQRAFLNVGTAAGTPEFTARLAATGSAINASARIGILEASITGATLAIGSSGTEDAAAASCTNGIDDGDSDGADAEDEDDCEVIVIDIYDDGGADGKLTIEELFNVLGDTTAGGPTFDAEAHAKLDATIPVSAELGGVTLGGGNVVVTGLLDGDLTSPEDLATGLDVDGSSLSASDLFNFSPCKTADDEDGDNKPNDGCPQVGDNAETGAQCDNNTDDDAADTDGAVNDGCPAVADPETESIALLDKIIALLESLADQFGTMEGDDTLGSSLSDPLPLLGDSFNDVLSIGDQIQSLADEMLDFGESGAECGAGDTVDDDHDGVVNDGCPTDKTPESGAECAGGEIDKDNDNDGVADDGCGGAGDPEAVGVPETGTLPNGDDQCTNTTDDEDNDSGTQAVDLDNLFNDGCPAVLPTLQRIEEQAEGFLADILDDIGATHGPAGDPDDVSPTDTALDLDITLDGTDLKFKLDLKEVSLAKEVALNMSLDDIIEDAGGDLEGLDIVGLEILEGTLEAHVDANLDLDFGIDLDDFSVFVLGSTALDLDAEADAINFRMKAGLGPIEIHIGTDQTLAETACGADTVDDDKDGYLNDGCAQDANPEVACEGADPVDDDNDGVPDDGCGGADPADPPAAGDAEGNEAGEETWCDAGNTADEDGDGLPNDGCPARADKGRVHVGASFDVVETHGDNDKVALASLDFDGTFDGAPQTGECPANEPACAILPLYFDLDGDGGNPPAAIGDETLGKHHITITISDLNPLASPTVNYPDFAQLKDIIADQLLDFLLMKSGLADFFNTLRSLLDGEIFGFELPLIGDQLDEAAAFIDKIEANLINGALNGDPLSGLDSLTAHASDVESALAGLKTTAYDALGDGTPVDILLDTNGDNVQNADDFNIVAFCGGQTCIDPEGDDPGEETWCDAGNVADEDGDGLVNDGCPADSTPESGTDCDPGNVANEDGDSLVNDGCLAFDPPAADVDEIRLYVRLGQEFDEQSTDPIAFNSGIPGLSLESSEGISLGGQWKFDLGVSLSKDKGFGILTQETEGGDPEGDDAGEETWCSGNFKDDDGDGIPNDGCDDELKISADVGIPEEFDANLGFIFVKIHDGHRTINDDPLPSCGTAGSGTDSACLPADHDPNEGSSSFTPAFTVNLMDPQNDDGMLTFADLAQSPDFDEILEFNFTADADVNLHIETVLFDEALPKLIGDVHLDWQWALNNPEADADALEEGVDDDCDTDNDGDVDGSDNQNVDCLSVSLDGLVLDAGTFLSKFLAPTVGKIKDFTEPLQPTIDILQACIPVLSDFSGSCVSLLTLIETFGPSDNNFDLLISLVKIISFINGIPDSPPGGDLTIPIGPLVGGGGGSPTVDNEFPLVGSVLQGGALPAAQAQSAFTETLSGFQSLLSSIDDEFSDGGSSLSDSEVSNTETLTDIGFTFPFLDHPEQIVMLLFGQNMDLVVFQAEASLKFEYSQKFGPVWSVPPVFIEVFGAASFTARIGVGLDTEGLRRVFIEGADAASLLDGFYFLDRDLDSNVDRNELELRGELGAGANVSLLIFSAGVRGGVFLTIGIDLQDPNGDGKLRFREIGDILEATGDPFCLFIFNGEFGIFLRVFAEIDLFFWSQRWETTLAEIVLLSFSLQCDLIKEPILAREESAGNGVLIVHVGAESTARGSGSVGYNNEAEEFKITKMADDTLVVSAFGFDEVHVTSHSGGWVLVKADAGDTTANEGGALDPEDDEDVISLVDGVVGSETECKAGESPCVAPGDGEANGCEEGNSTDEDQDGLVNDGCPPNGPEDPPLPEDADDDCDNSADDDSDGFINDGCPTSGEIVPFDVPSVLKGGPGNDKLTGGTTHDDIDGGSQDDQITARDGNNDVIGGTGADEINTGAGNDRILGDGGSIGDGTTGDNAGGGGSITPENPANAAEGSDSIQAGLGVDTVHGQNGDDSITGGISGAAVIAVGAPETVAQCGNGLDNDDDGAADDGCGVEFDGGDTIHGGAGTDDLNGEAGEDTINGNDGADNINGGTGNDDIFGGDETSPDQAGAAPEAGSNCDNGVNDDGGDDSVIDDGCPGDVIMGGPGSDDIQAGGGDDKVIGGNLVPGEPDEGDSRLNGDADDDQIFGDNVEFVDAGGGAVTFKLTDPAIGGADKMNGGDGNDTLRGQVGNDQMLGGNGDDNMDGNADQDIMLGDDGSISLALVVTVTEDGSDGVDTMHGSDQNDRMYGGGDGDFMFGDNGEDYMEGNSGDDDMHGGQLDDEMYGNAGNDTMFGDSGDDYMEGNAGADTMRGGMNQDDMIGGSSTAGANDDEALVGLDVRGDKLDGDSSQDVIVGDNGTITRDDPEEVYTPDLSVIRDVTVFDLDCDDDLEAGPDIINGGSGNDDLYGGGEADLIHGNAGDDYIEGNCDGDDLYGDANQDDIIGGTSDEADGPSAGGGVPDGDDDMWGGNNGFELLPTPQFDVMAGDNASIARATSGPNWVTDDFAPDTQDVVKRIIKLYDVGMVGAPVSNTLNGDDDMFGEAGYDIMYGQGGDDTMHGNAADDYIEGNAGDDTMFGDGGQDDMIGGTGRTISNDATSAANGRLDEEDPGDDNDTMYGGDGADGIASDDFDTIVGDNATVDRVLVSGAWDVNTFNDAVKRTIVFYDVGMITGFGVAAGAGTNGDDLQRGERNDDTMYGQGGNDDMQGNPGDDYMEGNDGSDAMQGNDGNDDMAGGTGRISMFDTVPDPDAVVADPPAGRDGRRDAGESSMSGGNGFDFMIGDNGVITRVLDGNGDWVPSTNHAGGPSVNGVQHNPVVLRDVQLLAGNAFAGASGGESLMHGDAHDDIMYGQGGNDEMFGDLGDDYMEGNHDNDTMRGNLGQDDMIGGGSDDSDTADAEETALDLLDGDDTMYGEANTDDGAAAGDAPDAMIGDNGTIDRCPGQFVLDCEWQTNTFNTAIVRVISLFDIELDDAPVDRTLSGDDDMWGNDNDDTMYGQAGEDDMFGGSGDDYMEGNHDSDVMFGGPQQDDMLGGTGRTVSNDDNTLMPGRTDASTETRGGVPLGPNASATVPLGDRMYGDSTNDGSTSAGDGADVMLGDNGKIVRPLDEDDLWIGLAYRLQLDEFGDLDPRHDTTGSVEVRRVERDVTNTDVTPGTTAGSDWMFGSGGDDDMYGQFDDANPAVPNPADQNPLDPANAVGDEMYGNDGEDAMAGDQGMFDSRVLPPPPQEHFEPNEPFIDDDRYITDTLFREMTLAQIPLGGNDRMRGGQGGDWMHGGAGHDVMNGDTGNDRLFGDDGADDMWGGDHHDHLWGGYGYDQLDLHPIVVGDTPDVPACSIPASIPATDRDPLEWYVFGIDPNTTCDGNFEGVDYIYGGWEADAMQANIGDNGPRLGDRLVDWVGVYNLYVLCPGTYGEFVSTREFSPAMMDFLFMLVAGDGTVDPTNVLSSGGNEIAFVYTPDLKDNANPPYVDTPSHFHCDNVEPIPTATPTGTATPTNTPGGPTETPTSTATPTATDTPKPGGKKTATPTPTPTP